MKFCPACGREFESGDVCEVDGTLLMQPQRSQADLLTGRVLKDSYRIEEKIGEGGMGIVFRGVQIALRRDVAIKVLMPGVHSTPSMIQRFFREARLLSQLNHPNVVTILDFGHTEDGMVFMVMELLSGATLHDVVPAGCGLEMARLIGLMRQTCSGVDAAHRRGLVHRDLKPDNVFVVSSSAEESVKILDFGIARTLEAEDQTRLTQAGHLVGTPGFLAPEQIKGRDADGRSDIYALGALLYFMATGRRPFAGATPHAIFARQLHEAPPLDASSLGDRAPLANVLDRALRVEPDERFQTAVELADALESTALAEGLIDEPVRRASGISWIGASEATPGRPLTAPTRLLSPTPDPAPRRRRRRLPKAAIAFCLVAVLAVVPLGFWLRSRSSDATTGAGRGDAAVAVTRGVSATEIAIGMSAAFSGPSLELGRAMKLGIETCFRDVADQGGIHGRHLNLIALDDGYEPGRTVTNMAKLLMERRVFAVLGNVGTPTAEVAVPFAVEERLPFLGAFSGADLLRRQPPDRLVFNFRASYAQETEAIVEYVLDSKGIHPREIAVFAQEDSYGDAGYRGVQATLTRRGHTDAVLRLGYRRNSGDVSEAVERLLRHEPEIRAVVLVATYRTAAEFIQQVEDTLGQDGRELLYASLSFVGSRAFAEELKSRGAGLAEGVIVTQVVPHFASDLPGVVRYRQLLAKYSPTEQPGFVSLEGYLAAQVFVEGLRRAGRDLTLDGFVDAIESIDDLDLQIGEPIRFGPERHQGSDAVWATVLDGAGEYHRLDLAGGA